MINSIIEILIMTPILFVFQLFILVLFATCYSMAVFNFSLFEDLILYHKLDIVKIFLISSFIISVVNQVIP